MWWIWWTISCSLSGVPGVEAGAAWKEPERTHLFLEAHKTTETHARYGAVRLTDGEQTALGSSPALPHPYREGAFETVATASSDAFAVAVGGDAAHTLQYRTLAGETRQLISPKRPSAMLLVHEHLFIGAENTVAVAAMQQAAPQVSVVLERPEMVHKAFDRFARDGDWLIAVDDVVMPFYADLFRLTAEGAPTHLRGMELPGIINGHYDLVALSEDAPGDGTLYVITPYGVMMGHGHDLAALPIRENALALPEEGMVLNSQVWTNPPTLEEHVPRGPEPARLWTGDHYTPIQAMDRLEDHLLLAAGDRGVMTISAGFSSADTMDALDVNGEARDVLVVGEVAWVLVHTDAGTAALQAVSVQDDGMVLGARHLLSEEYTRILR